MAQNPKYDNDVVNLGYLNKRLGQTEESINKNNNSISQLPKNYSIPPNPPYYKDSLLCYKNKIYKCNTTKLNGVFSWNDWTIAATDDTTLSDFINNTYELEKLEIQEQIDGKVQTYYQEMDPSNEWTTDLEKSKHIGDYWYNTTNNTQWRYNRNTTTTPITYGWGQVNVPNSVFDLIDKKKSIYTIKPTSYKKDDLWIIEDTLSDEDLPTGTEDNPIAKGDWVFSVADSDTYNKEHWIKRDEDISFSYLEQHYYTIGDIDSSFKELERNTDSKITKAKEEISLNVSQTYTTKEEHTKAINDFDKQIGTINDTITTHETNISNLNVGVGKISASVESIKSKTEELSVDIDGVKENIIPTSTVSGPNIHIEDASDKKMVNFELEGKSTQETSVRGINYCPDINEWTLTGGAYIENDYIVLPSNSANASSPFIPLDKQQYFWYAYAKVYIDAENNKLLCNTQYYDGNKKLISGNGNAVLIKDISSDNNYYWAFGGDSTTTWGQTLYNAKYIRINFSYNSNYSSGPYKIKNPMITSEQQQSFIPYVPDMPSPDYPSEIESVGYKNELYNTATTQTVNGITYTKNDDGSITLNGTATSLSYIQISNLIPLHGTFTLSGGESIGSNVYMRGLDIDDSYAVRFNTQPNKSSTATVNSNRFVFYLYVSSGTTLNNAMVYPQITKGSQVHSYIPYGKYGIELKVTNGTDTNTSLFVLDQPLRSLPNGVKDIAYIKNNILYVDRYVAENNINIISITTLSNGNIGGVARPTGKIKTGSNHLICSNAVVNKTIQDGTCYENPANVVFVGNSTDTLDTIKAKYDGGILYYELAEPYTEKIGEIEMPSTYKGVNNITTTDELEPVMNIEYVRDTILSDYVEGQVGNAVAIQERKNAEFQITNEEIKSSVSNISIDLDGTKSSLNSVEEKITSQEKTINIISKNIDGTTGDIREVTTTTGFTFNSEGLTIDDGAGYKAQHTAQGTFYKDGDSITGQYTKDGSKQKDLELFGTYSYGKNDINDTPMFVAQLYTDEKGEECFGHFYNGGDY